MSWEPRPVPEISPETAPYWAAAAEGRLLLCECQDCDLQYYYPRARCPDCLSGNVEWIDAAGTGTVYAYTATEIVSGWPEEHLPLVLAYVELDEGPRMLTDVVDCGPDEVEVGSSVEVTFVDTDDPDVAIPVFELRR
ncbi:OB-fold domain-containing protein [Halobellus ruber]|uniref:OB-fold domain-containing protein n=1 Tax=Halobellus ruber TaxID=2761102 RepID=A0A7J9SGD2_9EURY|nr:OB-fold domain-containing protein [Halobellus ruber]